MHQRQCVQSDKRTTGREGAAVGNSQGPCFGKDIRKIFDQAIVIERVQPDEAGAEPIHGGALFFANMISRGQLVHALDEKRARLLPGGFEPITDLLIGRNVEVRGPGGARVFDRRHDTALLAQPDAGARLHIASPLHDDALVAFGPMRGEVADLAHRPAAGVSEAKIREQSVEISHVPLATEQAGDATTMIKVGHGRGYHISMLHVTVAARNSTNQGNVGGLSGGG